MSSSISSTLIDKIRKSIASKHGLAGLEKVIEKEVLDVLFHRSDKYLLARYDDVLKDIKVQSSSYGKSIPKIYGTARISGNIIWANPINYTQHKKIKDVSSSKTTRTSTEYSATLAIAICAGPVQRLLKVWANGKLLDLTKTRYRFYAGTEEQAVDPLILLTEKYSPAYRGLSYIVIENLPLRNFKNSIPNFVFEVTSYPKKFLDTNVSKKINCVCTLGLGEFTYDTRIQKRINVSLVGGREISHGKAHSINGSGGETFAISSLNSLRAALPNIQWVSVPVHWFADDIGITRCHIYPSTTHPSVKTSPDEWNVGRFVAKNAITMSVINGQPMYPGTPSDGSLVRYLRELKSRGYKIMLSLKLIVINKTGSHILYTNADFTGHPLMIEAFFMDKYKSFLEHYSKLTKGLIDALVISEGFSKLTKMQDRYGAFPAVTSLINLAAYAKRIAGSNVIVTYAANWDEYHSYNGIYNMDPLWTSDSIDVIGIRAYFPLTDKNSSLNAHELAQGWKSGEGYDYFYDDNRQKKIPFQNEFWAWKNIQHWWENSHDEKSKWIPASKKIWFTEYGFRSVETCANFQPLSGYNHSITSSQSSTDSCSFSAQRVAIESTLHMWETSHAVEKMFLYAWDIGFTGDFSGMSADTYKNWKAGYSINRKIDMLSASAVLQDVLKDIPQAVVKCADTSVPEYLINNNKSIYDVLTELQKIYPFGVAEGAAELLVHDTSNVVDVPEQDIVYEEYSAIHAIENLYNPPALSYISMRCNYQPRMAQSPTNTHDAANILQMSIVLDDMQAERALEKLNNKMLGEKLLFKIILPIRYISLRVGEAIKVSSTMIRITDIKVRSFLVHVEGYSEISGEHCM